MKRKYAQVGDKIAIENPVFVSRVGYPYCIGTFEGVAQQALQKTGLLLGKTLTTHGKTLIRDYARYLLVQAGWGGPERTLHTYTKPELKGQEFVVGHRQTAYTGRRYPPSGYGEDYVEGGLQNRKVHILLRLESHFGGPFWIEATNVKVVAVSAGMTYYRPPYIPVGK